MHVITFSKKSNTYQNICSNMFIYRNFHWTSYKRLKHQFIRQNIPTTLNHISVFTIPPSMNNNNMYIYIYSTNTYPPENICLFSLSYQAFIYFNNQYCLGSLAGIISISIVHWMFPWAPTWADARRKPWSHKANFEDQHHNI